jgi:hypothetical protein
MTTLTGPQAQMLSRVEEAEAGSIRLAYDGSWLINGINATAGEQRVINSLLEKRVCNIASVFIKIHGRNDRVTVRALVIR